MLSCAICVLNVYHLLVLTRSSLFFARIFLSSILLFLWLCNILPRRMKIALLVRGSELGWERSWSPRWLGFRRRPSNAPRTTKTASRRGKGLLGPERGLILRVAKRAAGNSALEPQFWEGCAYEEEEACHTWG